jgi:predicted dehydrogenase
MSVKVGLAGLGRMGMLHLLSCLKMSHLVQVIGVADLQEKNQRYASKFGVKVYDDYKKLVEKGNMDCLIISLPNFLKEDCVRFAAEKGIDIYLEKPLGRSYSEAQRIVKIVEQHNVRLMVGSNYRYFPCVKEVKRLVEEGRIGEVHLANYELVMNGPFSHPMVPKPVSGWWFDPLRSGGGVLIDLGYHLIDLNVWFFGWCDVLFSNLRFLLHLPVEDTATFVLRSRDSGVVSVFNIGWFSKMVFPKFNFRINLHGEVGLLTTDQFAPRNMLVNAVKEGVKNIVRRLFRRQIRYLSYTYYYASFFEALQDFFVAVQKGLETPVPLEQQLEVMRIIDFIYSVQAPRKEIAA